MVELLSFQACADMRYDKNHDMVRLLMTISPKRLVSLPDISHAMSRLTHCDTLVLFWDAKNSIYIWHRIINLYGGGASNVILYVVVFEIRER